MAKILAPLFSVAASGTFAKLLTFRATRSGSVAQSPPIPTGEPSQAQAEERARFATALTAWAALDVTSKNEWHAAGLALVMQPVMLYTREYLLQRIAAPAQPLIPASR